MRPIKYDTLIPVGSSWNNNKTTGVPFKKTQGRRIEWYVQVQCECGYTQVIPCIRWITHQWKGCRKCIFAKISGEKSKSWDGYGELSGHVFSGIEHGAKRRQIEFNLTKEYLWTLFLQQNRKCAISGLPLTFQSSNRNTHDKIASLDRIDSNKPYIEGNVQWVHKDINIMKNRFTTEYFINLCQSICNHNTAKHSTGTSR